MNSALLREMFANDIDQVDRLLSDYLFRPRDPEFHYRMIRYHVGFAEDGSALPSGKRLRPLLSLLLGKASGAPAAPLRTLIVASEMFHAASLAHDDLQDGDEIRWGRPTLWSRFGSNQAINVGDAMIGMTYEVLSELRKVGVSAERVCRVMEVFNRAHMRMAEGQHMDLLAAGRLGAGVASYLDMIARKTAAACECAAHAAAVLAGADELEEPYRHFGHAFGMLYQICDDIQGVWGEAADTGKEPMRDLVLRKSTLPLICGVELGSEALRRMVMPAHTPGERRRSPSVPPKMPELTWDQVVFVRDELTRLGVDRICRERAGVHKREALQALEATGQSSPERTILERMTVMCAANAGVSDDAYEPP